MGRVSDAAYFCSKWKGVASVLKIVRLASLTYPRLMSHDMKDLFIPMSALLAQKIQRDKVQLESLLVFLMLGAREATSKEFFKLVKFLKPSLEEILTFLEEGNLDSLRTKSFTKREIALKNGPIELIRRRLVERILFIQKKIHGQYFAYSYLNRLVNKSIVGP